MDKFRILGPTRLSGQVDVGGAKNAALPILAASLLTDDPLELESVPRVADIRTMCRMLGYLDVDSEVDGSEVVLRPTGEHGHLEAPYDLVKTMRASVLVLGPLLATRGRARVSLPGGCAIGVRPIDRHLEALEALGATITIEHGDVVAEAPVLRGASHRFSAPTVGGTENAMMAAVLARGTTVLDNCAREPEIEDLARLLRSMGARLEGEGTDRIEIEGVERLHGARHRILPDRIEAGTWLIAGALSGGDVVVRGAREPDLHALVEKLHEVGALLEIERDRIRVRSAGELEARGILTEPHPGFPTDLQAQYMALMTAAQGTSRIFETVFENRFQHVPELLRMGADIRIDGHQATVVGPTPLSGARVMATDLRASASLVLAALVADGETVIDRIYHLDRGYEQMESKLVALGARVERISGS